MGSERYVEVDSRGRISLAKVGVKEGRYRLTPTDYGFKLERVHVYTRSEWQEQFPHVPFPLDN